MAATTSRHPPLQKPINAGGALVERDGIEVPAVYTAAAEEYAALRQAAALIDRSDAARPSSWARPPTLPERPGDLRREGSHPGQGAYGYLTDRQGKILADVAVLALEDRLWLELPPSAGETVRAHLEKYIIADRVEVKPLGDLVL
jgi:glycine cleavage system aminomethyltransferase T